MSGKRNLLLSIAFAGAALLFPVAARRPSTGDVGAGGA